MVSLLIVTLNRYDLTVKCVDAALVRAGTELELLSCDNGSSDKRVVEYIASKNPAYHRINTANEGYAPALNQLLRRRSGTHVCVLDPDIMVPNNWLKKLVDVNNAIPWSGVSAFHCVEQLKPAIIMEGMEIHPGDVFGIKFFSCRVLRAVGGFCEDYTPYGLEDRDYLYRVFHSGFMSYYLGAGDRAEHLGNDVGEQTPYRKMKWESLHRAVPKMDANLEKYARTRNYYIPIPEAKDSI